MRHMDLQDLASLQLSVNTAADFCAITDLSVYFASETTQAGAIVANVLDVNVSSRIDSLEASIRDYQTACSTQFSLLQQTFANVASGDSQSAGGGSQSAGGGGQSAGGGGQSTNSVADSLPTGLGDSGFVIVDVAKSGFFKARAGGIGSTGIKRQRGLQESDSRKDLLAYDYNLVAAMAKIANDSNPMRYVGLNNQVCIVLPQRVSVPIKYAQVYLAKTNPRITNCFRYS